MAARRVAEDVLATVPGALRRRPRLLATLPAPPGRRLVLRRAHDRASRRRPPTRATKETIFHAHQKIAHRAHRRSRDRSAGTTTPRRRASFRCAPGIPSRFCTSRSARSPRSSARAHGGWLRNPDPATSRPSIRSCSTRRSGRPDRRPSTTGTRSTTRRSPAASRTERSRSTPAFATCCARCATRTGRFVLPGDGPTARVPAPDRVRGRGLRGRGVRPRRDRRHRPRRAARARARADGSTRSSEARSGQLVDWRGDDAGHDAARARRDRHRRRLARVPPERRRRPRDRDRQPLAGRDDRGARGVRAVGARPPDPRAGRGPPPERVGDADGSPRRHRVRRRLGDQLGCGRVLVAARRVALRGARGGAAALRDGRRVPPRLLPASRRGGLRRAHDRAFLRARADQRPRVAVQADPEDHPPRPSRDRADARATTRWSTARSRRSAAGSRSSASTSRSARRPSARTRRSSRARRSPSTSRGRRPPTTPTCTRRSAAAGSGSTTRRSSSPTRSSSAGSRRGGSSSTRGFATRYARSQRGGTPAFPVPTLVEDAEYAVEAAVLGEADVVRLQRRLDELERRLGTVEQRLPTAGVPEARAHRAARPQPRLDALASRPARPTITS